MSEQKYYSGFEELCKFLEFLNDVRDAFVSILSFLERFKGRLELDTIDISKFGLLLVVTIRDYTLNDIVVIMRSPMISKIKNIVIYPDEKTMLLTMKILER